MPPPKVFPFSQVLVFSSLLSFGSGGEVNGKETQNTMTAAKVGAGRMMAFACALSPKAKGSLWKPFYCQKEELRTLSLTWRNPVDGICFSSFHKFQVGFSEFIRAPDPQWQSKESWYVPEQIKRDCKVFQSEDGGGWKGAFVADWAI